MTSQKMKEKLFYLGLYNKCPKCGGEVVKQGYEKWYGFVSEQDYRCVDDNCGWGLK